MKHLKNSLGLFVCIFLSFALNVPEANGENIVFFFGMSSYSHRIPAWPLVEALAEKGHNVTFVSPFPSKSPNPKVFDYLPKKLKEWVDTWEDIEDVFQDRKNGKVMDGWLMLPQFGVMMCEVLYSDEEFVNWVKTTKVDLIYIDALFNDCAYGMAHVFGAKIVQYDTTTVCPWYMDAYGIPDETSWIPDLVFSYPVNMTFSQRVKNALSPVAWHLYRKWVYFPQLEKLTRESLGISELPNFEEIEKNTSLVFVNTHYGEEFSRSLPPNVIPIGGIAWSEKRKPLPKDLEEFLNKGNGFIYMSFGTYADFQRMDANIQQALIGAMKAVPDIQFVWKVGNKSLADNFPKRNVYINSWMPQQDILSHPKIKAFITHSGLIGIQEAVTCGVPLISFPIFAEQDYNAERVHRRESGVRLEITDVTQAQLENAIITVLTNPKYRENMKQISTAFNDRLNKPLETALWWTEYILRHDRAHLATLRPLSVNLTWWQRRQLDVWITVIGAITLVIILSSYLIVKVLQCTLRMFNSKRQSTRREKAKKVQ